MTSDYTCSIIPEDYNRSPTGHSGRRGDGGKERTTLGALELEVLKIIWECPACTVAEVAERLSRRQYARTTVLTVIQRLHAKGLLKRRKEAGIFRYSATQPREQVLSRLIARFVRMSSTVLRRRSWPT